MTKKKAAGVDKALDKAISDLLKSVMADSKATITDKMKVIDRALKLEAIKQKMKDDDYGTGFFKDDDEPNGG